MKNALLLLSASLIFLASCKEYDLPLTGGSKTLNDTTYVATAEAAQPHNVLLEEFTGSSCSNCPPAHIIIESQKAIYGSKLNVISIHPRNIPQGQPVAGNTYDFRTQAGTDITEQVYGTIIGMPEAGIDRTLYSSNLQLTDDAWPSAIAARTSLTGGINLHVTSHYNAAAGNDTIAVTIAYTQAISTTQHLNIAIVEDSLYDAQEDGPTKVDQNYLYTDVFRALVTADPSGDKILPNNASKEIGRVVKLYYLYKVDTKVLYNPKNCRVIVFVTDGASGNTNVLQSVQTSFTGQ
jgi:hypothetical protein